MHGITLFPAPHKRNYYSPRKARLALSTASHLQKTMPVRNSDGHHAHFPFVMVFCPAIMPGKFCVPNVCALNFFTMKLNNLNPLA